MNFDGIMKYQEKDMELYQLQNDFNNSEVCVKNRKATQALEFSKKNIDTFETEIDAILTKYNTLKQSVESINEELSEFDDIIASSETIADIDFYTRKISELQDKLSQAEKELNLSANRMEEINLEYNKNINLQKQATVMYNETTVQREELKNQTVAKGKPIQAEMMEIKKTVDPRLMETYIELKKTKAVKYPLVASTEKGAEFCPKCGIDLEKEAVNILKSTATFTQCSRCHRILFAVE